MATKVSNGESLGVDVSIETPIADGSKIAMKFVHITAESHMPDEGQDSKIMMRFLEKTTVNGDSNDHEYRTLFDDDDGAYEGEGEEDEDYGDEAKNENTDDEEEVDKEDEDSHTEDEGYRASLKDFRSFESTFDEDKDNRIDLEGGTDFRSFDSTFDEQDDERLPSEAGPAFAAYHDEQMHTDDEESYLSDEDDELNLHRYSDTDSCDSDIDNEQLEGAYESVLDRAFAKSGFWSKGSKKDDFLDQTGAAIDSLYRRVSSLTIKSNKHSTSHAFKKVRSDVLLDNNPSRKESFLKRLQQCTPIKADDATHQSTGTNSTSAGNTVGIKNSFSTESEEAKSPKESPATLTDIATAEIQSPQESSETANDAATADYQPRCGGCASSKDDIVNSLSDHASNNVCKSDAAESWVENPANKDDTPGIFGSSAVMVFRERFIASCVSPPVESPEEELETAAVDTRTLPVISTQVEKTAVESGDAKILPVTSIEVETAAVEAEVENTLPVSSTEVETSAVEYGDENIQPVPSETVAVGSGEEKLFPVTSTGTESKNEVVGESEKVEIDPIENTEDQEVVYSDPKNTLQEENEKSCFAPIDLIENANSASSYLACGGDGSRITCNIGDLKEESGKAAENAEVEKPDSETNANQETPTTVVDSARLQAEAKNFAHSILRMKSPIEKLAVAATSNKTLHRVQRLLSKTIPKTSGTQDEDFDELEEESPILLPVPRENSGSVKSKPWDESLDGVSKDDSVLPETLEQKEKFPETLEQKEESVPEFLKESIEKAELVLSESKYGLIEPKASGDTLPMPLRKSLEHAEMIVSASSYGACMFENFEASGLDLAIGGEAAGCKAEVTKASSAPVTELPIEAPESQATEKIEKRVSETSTTDLSSSPPSVQNESKENFTNGTENPIVDTPTLSKPHESKNGNGKAKKAKKQRFWKSGRSKRKENTRPVASVSSIILIKNHDIEVTTPTNEMLSSMVARKDNSSATTKKKNKKLRLHSHRKNKQSVKRKSAPHVQLTSTGCVHAVLSDGDTSFEVSL